MKISAIVLGLVLVLSVGSASQVSAPKPPIKQEEVGDPEVLALMKSINKQLEEMGMNIAVEKIEFFTIGKERPSNRIHQQDFQWVPNDPRRGAAGNAITYLVQQSEGATSSGLTNAQTEAAIDLAMNTWQAERCLQKVNIIKQADPGTDPDIFDGFFGGSFGTPFADITNAGWDPTFTPILPPTTLAFTVTFIFVQSGIPTDINGDNYLDTALKEVYYNNNPVILWGINVALPGIDVESVALHENGHSLSIGHFGPPPVAVMNPVYAGIQQAVLPIDHAGMCTLWASWPNR